VINNNNDDKKKMGYDNKDECFVTQFCSLKYLLFTFFVAAYLDHASEQK